MQGIISNAAGLFSTSSSSIITVFLLSLLSLTPFTQATTVSYLMAPHERACFYTEAKVPGEKLAFYFAVQSGGNFDVDFDVTDPLFKVLLSGQGERQGDYVLSANGVGEYSFCFSNTMSTFAEKYLDFDITIQHEVTELGAKGELEEAVGLLTSKPKAPLNPPYKGANAVPQGVKGKVPEVVQQALDKVKEGLNDISSGLTSLYRVQRQIRTNEHRNVISVTATGSRIVWSAVIESLVMVGIAALQVYLIQTFFSKSSRTRV